MNDFGRARSYAILFATMAVGELHAPRIHEMK